LSIKFFETFPASDFRCAPGAKAQGASGSLENIDAVHVFARFARSFCPWRRSFEVVEIIIGWKFYLGLQRGV
jgi:hypothetical protein